MKLMQLLFSSKKKKQGHLSRCPDDMIREMMSYLTIDDQMRLATVNKAMNQSVEAGLDPRRIKAHVSELNTRIKILSNKHQEIQEKRHALKRQHTQEMATTAPPHAISPFGGYAQGSIAHPIMYHASRFFLKREEEKVFKNKVHLESVQNACVAKISS